jgi:hypothetical protein
MEGTPPIVPAPPARNRTWIWIAVVVGVLCLCLALLAAAIGLYFTLKPVNRIISLPEILPQLEKIPSLPFIPSLPIQPLQPDVPVQVDELVIDPYQPSPGDATISLAELVPAYEPANQPGTSEWKTSIPGSLPVLVYFGWCTTTRDVLEQNYSHLLILVEADGAPVPDENLSTYDDELGNQVCRARVGIVRQWPPGEHTIRISLLFDAPVNDGISDYPAGDYVDVFRITVLP